jgi:Holliday junction resolvase RusA-like endonuclease
MRFTLPLCPTTNHMYGHSGHRTYKTKETVEWEREAQAIILSTKGRKKLIGHVYVGVELFLKYDRDVENNKPINDALEDNGIIDNDRQVTHLNVKKYMDKKNPRIEIEVVEIDK